MNFNDLKQEIRTFLENSNVNLGRKNAKTRKDFIEFILKRMDDLEQSDCCHPNTEENMIKEEDSTDNRLLCLKPGDPRAALSMGKGVHAMTPGQSRVADEQLNRSPYSKGGEK